MKKTNVLVAVFLAGILSLAQFVVSAADDFSGIWYGLLYNYPIMLEIKDDNTYALTVETDDSDAMEGKWKVEGDTITLDPDEETSTYAVIEDGSLVFEDGEMVLSREKVEPFKPADPKKDAKEEDYDGNWICKMTALGDYYEDADQESEECTKAEIKAGKILLDEYFIGEEHYDMEGVFEDGAYTATHEEEYMEPVVWKIVLLEDGLISASYTIGESEITYFLEKVEE